MTDARNVRRLLGCIGALLLSACDTGESMDAETAYRSAPVLALQEQVRFCANEEIVECQLNRMAFAVPAPGGGAIIGMPTGPVTRFDSMGALVVRYGRPGSGPGEYARVLGAHMTPDDRVVLHDFGLSRRVVFGLDGSSLGTHPDEPDFGIRDLQFGTRGFAVLSDPPAEPGDSVLSEFRLLRDTLPPLVIAYRPHVRVASEQGFTPMGGFFADRPRWAVESDSTVLLAEGPNLRIVRIYNDRREEDVLNVPALGNRRVTAEDVEKLRTDRMKNWPSGTTADRQALERALANSAANAAEYHAFTDQLQVLDDGAILHRENDVRSDSARWTLFDEDGAVLGQLHLQQDAAIWGGTRDRLLTIIPDERDVPIVAWNRVVGGRMQ